MRFLMVFAFLFASMSYAAESKLAIKLEGYYFHGNKEVKINVSKLNVELKKRGLAGLPEAVFVGSNPHPYWNLLKKRIDAANASLGREMHFNIYDDGYGEGYIYKMKMCYAGQITDVPRLIEAMTGTFFNPEQGILAIAAGSKKMIADEAFASIAGLKERFGEEFSANLKNINLWLKYNKASDTALVMSDYGAQGDGTELEATLIPRCKNQ